MTQSVDLVNVINSFVKGCKTDGTWDAIKACCIMAAWDGLDGALVPLKGPAPTNNNFVAADYDRETGLVGDGVSKYLGSNRALNADPQDSIHIAANATVYPAVTSYMMGAETTTGGAVNFGYFGSSFARCRNSSEGYFGSNTAGFMGLSRSTSTDFDFRVGQSTTSFTRTSTTPYATQHSIFGSDTTTGARFTGRLSFYSIGEAIDLEKLDTRTTQLMNGISYVVSPDADAQTYIQAVETADNRTLEFYVAAAINAFVVGCKADGIWNAIKSSCILAGAQTLAGALVPLVGTAPDNGSGGSFEFSEADYDRKLGLKGSLASPYPTLFANRLSSDDPQNDHHLSVYVTEQGRTTSNNTIAQARSGADATEMFFSNNTVVTRSRNTTTAFSSSNISGLGATLIGISRSASTEFKTRYYGTTATTSSTSAAPTNDEYSLLGIRSSSINFSGR